LERATIGISSEQHKKPEATVAINGRSIKEDVWDCTLGAASTFEGTNNEQAFRL
jgi:Antitoxin ParD